MKLREQINRELSEMNPKEEILQDILNQTRPNHTNKFRLLPCVVLLALLTAIPVSANMLGTIMETTRITDENRDMIDQPNIAVAKESPADQTTYEVPELLMDDPRKAEEATGGIIKQIEDGAFLPDVITVITLSPASAENRWTIPELLTENGFTTIFTKENGAGWELKKGETLHMYYQIGEASGNSPKDQTGTMEIGYIGNHVYYSGETFREQNFEYTLTAPEDGIYYLYTINAAAGKLYLTGGEISH